ncbi:MAG TPA: hypothetical protein PLL10_09835, partial [Elusimicrobiales bacterium]|nr:hypothetical protein [Elusimicrobiales bacterium]
HTMLLSACAALCCAAEASAYTGAWPEEAQTLAPRQFSWLSAFESDEHDGTSEITKPISTELRLGVAKGWEVQLEKVFTYHDFGGTQFDYWETGGTTLGPKALLRGQDGNLPAVSVMPYVTFGDSRKSPPPGGRYGGILFLSRALGPVNLDLDLKAEGSAARPLYSFYGGARGPLWGRDLEGFVNLRGDYMPAAKPANEIQTGLRLNYFNPVCVAFRYDFHFYDMRMDNDWVAALSFVSAF